MVMTGKLSAVQSSHNFVTDDQSRLLEHHRWHCCAADRLTDAVLMLQSESTDCGVTPYLCIYRKAAHNHY